VLVAVDILINALLGGKKRQTISGRLGSSYQGSLPERFVDWLFYYTDADHDHCEDQAEIESSFINL
jgi:hypothetical protein